MEHHFAFSSSGGLCAAFPFTKIATSSLHFAFGFALMSQIVFALYWQCWSEIAGLMVLLHKGRRDRSHCLKWLQPVCGLRWAVIWPSTVTQEANLRRDDPGKPIPPLKHHLFVSFGGLIQLTKCLLFVPLHLQGCWVSSGSFPQMDTVQWRPAQVKVSSPELRDCFKCTECWFDLEASMILLAMGTLLGSSLDFDWIDPLPPFRQ